VTLRPNYAEFWIIYDLVKAAADTEQIFQPVARERVALHFEEQSSASGARSMAKPRPREHGDRATHAPLESFVIDLPPLI
jgi:hypothetical protein